MLLRESSPRGVWSHLTAHIGADGGLVISGHDLGPGASLTDDELEYWIGVEESHLERLAKRLRGLLGEDGQGERASIPGTPEGGFHLDEFDSAGQLVQWMKSEPGSVELAELAVSD